MTPSDQALATRAVAGHVFNPYYEWLSIPPEEQPADLYRVLGLKRFESNAKVIHSAADRQMAHVRTFAGGPQGGIAQRVLNELANARVVLTDEKRKAAYDFTLQAANSDEEASQTQADAAASAAQGQTLGAYRVLHLILQGATGNVYKAIRGGDRQVVALKVVPEKLAADENFLKRLRREFNLTQGMSHPHVVSSYELGEAQGRTYLAFEYVGGADLGRLVSEHGPLDVPNAVEICKRIAEGLSHLHRKGIVHRNLKPQSVFVNVQGAVKIANLTMALEDDVRALLANHDRDLTQPGEALGSPDYLAPEQAVDAHTVDGRADLYSLGCTLHYLLTGKPPYGGKNATQKLHAHREAAVPSLRAARAEVPEWLDELFQKLLAKRPGERPASANDVARILDGRAEKQFNTTLLIVGGVAAAVLIFLLGLVVVSQLNR
jgi:serine/threonine protein kinase